MLGNFCAYCFSLALKSSMKKYYTKPRNLILFRVQEEVIWESLHFPWLNPRSQEKTVPMFWIQFGELIKGLSAVSSLAIMSPTAVSLLAAYEHSHLGVKGWEGNRDPMRWQDKVHAPNMHSPKIEVMTWMPSLSRLTWVKQESPGLKMMFPGVRFNSVRSALLRGSQGNKMPVL